ncbi:MAG: sulfatase-like hydrolase/transferase [Puniceicoccaceae bacterium]
MKSPLLLTIAILAPVLSQAGLQEGFEYPVNADLDGGADGTGFDASWSANANMDVFAHAWSAWKNYTVLAEKAIGPDDNGDVAILASRSLADNIDAESGQTLYFSYTLNADPDHPGWTNFGLHSATARSTSSDKDNFFVQYNGSWFHITGDAGLSNDTKPAPDGAGRGVDYLIAGKITFNAGQDSTELSVFAPGEDAREAVTAFETGSSPTITGTLTELVLRMNNSSRVGNIRVGNSLEEVGISTPPPPPSRDPIVYFSFDEGTVSGLTVMDLSGNGNHGTLINTNGTVVTDAVGAFGKAFFFPYSDGAQGLVSLPSGIVPAGNAPRSFACWFRQINDPEVDSATAQNKIFGYGTASADPAGTGLESFDVSLRYDTTNSENDIDIRGWGGIYKARDAGPRYEDEKNWHHLAIVVPEGASAFADIITYVDGMELPKNNLSFLLNTTNTEFAIGTVIGNGTSGNDYNGYVDEFRIYDIALKPTEVAALASEVPAAIPGTIERFSVSPRNRVLAGTPVTLSWQVDRVQEGTDVTIDNGIGVVSIDANGEGSLTFPAPAFSTTYTLAMTDETGSVLTSTTSVVVGGSPLPNIILFLVDDMGWADWEHNSDDTSSGDYATETINTGSTFYETPQMNSLAREGMWFRNAYADSPVCSPTRASIMTGQSPARNKVSDWITGRGDADMDVYEAEWTKFLSADLRRNALPAILAHNGYKTIHVGKWHLGAAGSPSDSPISCGFDVNIGGGLWGTPPTFFADSNGSFRIPGMGNGSFPQYTYLTDALTTRALVEIETAANAGDAFFLYLSHYDVHAPVDAPKATADAYEAKLHATGGWDSDGNHALYGGQQNAVYAAKIDHMDASLGDVLAKLRELNIDENTLIIFYADNGGWESSPRSSVEGSGGSDTKRVYYGSGSIIGETVSRPATDNAPLHMGKGYLYEGGIREPALFWWPGMIPAARIEDTPIVSRDLYTTILDIAGVPLPEDHAVDGRSLAPLLGLSGGSFSRPEGITLHYPHQSDQGGLPGSVVRQGNWKLIHFYNHGGRPAYQGDPAYDSNGDASRQQYVLYDLANDLGESTDLSASEGDLRAVLQYDLVHGLSLHEANFPRTKTGGFPLTPVAGKDPDTTDADRDSLSARIEALAGSSDSDRSSRFSASLSVANPEPEVTISGKKGRIYTLHRSGSLEPDSWILVDRVGPLTDDELILLSDSSASGFTRVFYRVGVSLQ